MSKTHSAAFARDVAAASAVARQLDEKVLALLTSAAELRHIDPLTSPLLPIGWSMPVKRNTDKTIARRIRPESL